MYRKIDLNNWGKLYQDEKDCYLPISLHIHHALADGYHASLFFHKLTTLLNGA